MTRVPRPAATAALLLLLAPALGTAGEMKADRQYDGTNSQALQRDFGVYPPRTRSIFPEAGGLRVRLSGGVKGGVAQTGAYSKFTLAGDCEVTLSYELLNVPLPQTGYGCSLGLAFDVGGGGARGDIQRLEQPGGKSGYALHTGVPGGGGKLQDEDRFVPSTAKRGKIGLRRVKKELIFLAGDGPAASLEEVERLPFLDGTVQAVRLFADPGGSPTAVDVRFRDIAIHAEEITGGVPEKEQRASWWWLWVVVPAAGGVPLFWAWRTYRRRSSGDEG